MWKAAKWREAGCECADLLGMESERREPLGTKGENVSVNNCRGKVSVH